MRTLQILLSVALLSSSWKSFAADKPADGKTISLLKQYALAPSIDCQPLLPIALKEFRAGKYSQLGEQLAPIYIGSVKRLAEDQFATEFLGPEKTYPVFLMRKQLDNTFASLFVDCEAKIVYLAIFGGFSEGQYWFGPFDLNEKDRD